MKKIATISVFFWFLLSSISYSGIFFSDNNGLKTGVIFGGPLPSKWSEEFNGYPKFGIKVGFFLDYEINESLSIISEMNIAYKGVDFTAFLERDTIVEVEMMGEKGNIPTYFTADIDGEMEFFYIDIPILVKYDLFGMMTLLGGVQLSVLAGGDYSGKAHVIVGEGGFYDDIIEEFDNFNQLNRFDMALCLGGEHRITEDFRLSILATRSLLPLMRGESYNSKYIDTGNMYNTYVSLSIMYSL
jgi:hypothetical protein